MPALLNQEKLNQTIVPVLSALLDDTLSASAPAGVKLVSAVLYGSATGRDYNPSRSDINVFMVFDRVNIDLLASMREVFARHFKKLKTNPVVLDTEYMSDSLDVFPMEFLEWKERSIVLYGEDPLGNVIISDANLRISLEQNLRGKRLRLIQSYFEFDPRSKKFLPFLLSTLPNFVVVSRNILRLVGADVPMDAIGMIESLEKRTGVQAVSFKRLVQIKIQGIKLGEKETDMLFKHFLSEIDALIAFVDSFDSGEKA